MYGFRYCGDGCSCEFLRQKKFLTALESKLFFTGFVSYAGQSKSFFDVIVDVFYDTILPLNGLLICLFVIYRWKKVNFNKELDEGAPNYEHSWFERYVDFSVGTFIPVILLLVLINTIALKFFGAALIG